MSAIKITHLHSGMRLQGRYDLQQTIGKGSMAEAWEALDHQKGIVHRDLKPANIILARLDDGARRVKVLDFGVARLLDFTDEDNRLTRTGTVLGSPRYMSLEVARGAADVDARADLFSVGAMMYHALGGTPPFAGPGLGAIMLKILRQDIPPLGDLRPDLSPDLLAFVKQAMGRLPGDRFPSTEVMRQRLLELLALEKAR